MKRIFFPVLALFFLNTALRAQSDPTGSYLQELNKLLPHKFKELKVGATLEAVREQNTVKLYMLVDDVEQYEQIIVERCGEQQNNFARCKVVQVQKGKYKNNYVEVTDQYPLPPKMTNQYRIKTITSEGITRMFPPVPVVYPDEAAKK